MTSNFPGSDRVARKIERTLGRQRRRSIDVDVIVGIVSLSIGLPLIVALIARAL